MVWYALLMLIILALWSAYITAVHTFGGARRVVAPFREATVEPFARGTLLVVWHMVTWSLLTLTGALALAAFSPRFHDLVAFAAIQMAGFAVVFFVTSRRELGAGISLPQWLLIGPLALGLAATELPRSAASAAAVLVGLIGLGHLAWAFGAPWPARDRAQLTAHEFPRVEGAAKRFARLPSRGVTLFVTVVFLGMSACLAATTSRGLVLGIAAIFALRGVVGLAYWSRRRERTALPSPFYVYNRFMYSPGCLLIAALAAASVT